MTLAHDLLSFAGVLLATIAGGVFVLMAVAKLWDSDEACQPAPDPDPKKKPVPAPPTAAATPGPTSNPVDVGWQFHDTRPDVRIEASLSPPLSTREQPWREYCPAGYWHAEGFVLGTTPTRPGLCKRLVWRVVFGLRWQPISFPHP